MDANIYSIICSTLVFVTSLSIVETSEPIFKINDTIISFKMATTYLNCVTHDRFADETVSWIRLKDDQILSIGQFKFTNNPRIGVIHEPSRNIWRLQIRYTAFEDEGLYECQITTSNPEKVGLVFNLTVLPDESYYLKMQSKDQAISSRYQQTQQSKRSPLQSSSMLVEVSRKWLIMTIILKLILIRS